MIKNSKGGVKIRLSKDMRAVIIGGKRWPPTQNNLEAWRAYQQTGDKEQLMFKLSTVVIDFEMPDPNPTKSSTKLGKE